MKTIRLTMTEEQLGVLIGALNVCQRSVGLDATAQMADLMKVIERKQILEDEEAPAPAAAPAPSSAAESYPLAAE